MEEIKREKSLVVTNTDKYDSLLMEEKPYSREKQMVMNSDIEQENFSNPYLENSFDNSPSKPENMNISKGGDNGYLSSSLEYIQSK